MDPEAGGEPPTNTPALFKPDSAVNQRPRIWIKKTGLRRYGDQKVKKESEALVNLFVYYYCNCTVDRLLFFQNQWVAGNIFYTKLKSS